MADEKAPLSVEEDVRASVLAAAEKIGAAETETPTTEAGHEPGKETAAPGVGVDPTDGAGAGKGSDAGRARDEKGRFAAREAADDPGKAPAAQPAAGDSKPPVAEAKPAEGQPAAQSDAGNRPPPGWSVPSKADWDKLPAHVRADIAKREAEVNNGFAKLADYKGLDEFAAMAKQGGTTLHAALKSYTTVENTLRAHPQQGLIQMAQAVGWDQATAARNFAEIAQALGFKPSSPAAHQPGAGADPAGAAAQNGQAIPPDMQALIDAHVAPLREKLQQFEGTLTQQQQAAQNRVLETAQSVVAAFEADPANRYYANVEPVINDLLGQGVVVNGVLYQIRKTGDFAKDLRNAYEQACKLNPEVNTALVNEQNAKTEAERKAKEQEAAAKARNASRSIAGSAAPGTVVVPPRPNGQGPNSILDDVRAAAAKIGFPH